MTGSMDIHAQLRERLGPGARYDDLNAPAEELRWARLGTAYFARKLNQLSDKQLAAQSDEGLHLRRVICNVSYQARSFAQLIEWARNGVLRPREDPFEAQAKSAELGLTLPAAALRHLFKHSEVHLNVEWRDLRGDQWNVVVCLPGEKAAAIRETARKRARALWLNAVDLGNGGSFADFPPDFVDALLIERSTEWNQRHQFTLHASDRQTLINFGLPAWGLIVRGKAADLARWVTGRGVHDIEANGQLPDITPGQSL